MEKGRGVGGRGVGWRGKDATSPVDRYHHISQLWCIIINSARDWQTKIEAQLLLKTCHDNTFQYSTFDYLWSLSLRCPLASRCEKYALGTSFSMPHIVHFHLRPFSDHVTYGWMYVRQRLHLMTPVLPKSTTSIMSLPVPLSPANGFTTNPA